MYICKDCGSSSNSIFSNKCKSCGGSNLTKDHYRLFPSKFESDNDDPDIDGAEGEGGEAEGNAA